MGWVLGRAYVDGSAQYFGWGGTSMNCGKWGGSGKQCLSASKMYANLIAGN